MIILGTGLTGLIGSRIIELLDTTYTLQNISRTTGIDITRYNEVEDALTSSEAGIVVHLAAYTDVKKAENEKYLEEKSEAWKVNVLGTQNLAKASAKTGKKLIYFSTDLVFDGEHTPEGGYKEDDVANPLNWYAKTKYEGEMCVKKYAKDWTILRVAYPYRANFSKIDFVRFFLQKLQNKENITVLSDRIITPTFIDDVAHALDIVIQENALGIYHVVGSKSLSIYDCAKSIAQVFNADATLIHAIARSEFLIGRPDEPFNSSLNNAKIKTLGVQMKGFTQGLEEIKRQLSLNF